VNTQFTVRDSAIRYYLGNLGFSIVPISPGSKAPTTKQWNQPGGYYEPRHIETALGFFKIHPKHNLGLVHGPSNTTAFDIDHNEYTRIAFAALGLDLTELLSAYPTPRIRGNPEKLAKPIYKLPAGVTLTCNDLKTSEPRTENKSRGWTTIIDNKACAGTEFIDNGTTLTDKRPIISRLTHID
jgi:putative DNA primase/helicase